MSGAYPALWICCRHIGAQGEKRSPIAEFISNAAALRNPRSPLLGKSASWVISPSLAQSSHSTTGSRAIDTCYARSFDSRAPWGLGNLECLLLY